MRQGSWNDLKDRVKALEEQVEAQSMEIARLKERREPPITREHQFDWRERGKPVSRGVNEMISDKLPGGFALDVWDWNLRLVVDRAVWLLAGT